MSSKLKITNAADSKPVVWFYGEIGWDFDANDFRRALESVGDADIELRINSPGGSYTEAIAMHTTLARRKSRADVVVDGLAASGGSIVAMAGATVTMAQGSMMMIHEARGSYKDATEAEIRSHADVVKGINAELLGIYTKRWKGDEAALKSALAAETWYMADDAVKAGLADRVGSDLAIAAYVDPSRFAYAKVPDQLVRPAGVLPESLAARKAILEELHTQHEEETCESK